MGGNQKLKEFFNNYQLMDTPVHDRYTTNAAAYYRKMIKARSQGTTLDEAPPTFDKGREPAPFEKTESYEERMAMSGGS